MQKTKLTYIAPLARYEREKPYAFNFDPGADVPMSAQSNIEYEEHEIALYNVRGETAIDFSYAEHGFRFVKHPSTSPVTFERGPEETQNYCKHMTKFVAKEFDAAEAICYDFRARRNGVTSSEYKANMDLTRATVAPPVLNVHVDHTLTSGLERIRRHLSESEAEKFLGGNYRCRIVNVWRPLYRPLQDCPLAFCAANTVSLQDLVPADRINPDFVAEISYLKYSPRQRWYWMKDQQPDEIAVFVQFDSGAAKFSEAGMTACPHAAFVNPDAPPDAPPRESIEVRIIIFNEI